MIESPSRGRHEFESAKPGCDFSGGAQRSVLHVNDPKKTGARSAQDRSAAKIHQYCRRSLLEVIAGQVYGPELFIYVDCPEPEAKLGTLLEYLFLQKENPERKEKLNRASGKVQQVLYGTVLYICTGCIDFNNLNDPNPETENIVISESFQSLKNFTMKSFPTVL